jgi:hypothetical protein
MPQDLYRTYTVERAEAGAALTMTGDSASVSRDSPPAFSIVSTIRQLQQLNDIDNLNCPEHQPARNNHYVYTNRQTFHDPIIHEKPVQRPVAATLIHVISDAKAMVRRTEDEFGTFAH